jgi:hypothetical protein
VEVGLGGIRVGVLEGMGRVFVGRGVFVGGTGVRVGKEAPGVRNPLIQTGWVRMEGSRGTKKPLGLSVRKSLSGSRFDRMFVSSLQRGAKRIAQLPARMTHRNPINRMIRMITQSRRSCSVGFPGSFIVTCFRQPAVL